MLGNAPENSGQLILGCQPGMVKSGNFTSLSTQKPLQRSTLGQALLCHFSSWPPVSLRRAHF